MSQTVTTHEEPATEDPTPEPVTLEPPNLKDARFGTLGELWAVRKRYKKKQKLLSKGYVQWILIDDSYPEPRFVKPIRDGSGIPYVKHNGGRYLFPRSAMLPSKNEGVWTIVHKKGDAEPLNLQNPSELAIAPDALDEYINMGVSSSAPGLWQRLNMDSQDLIRYAVLAIIGIAILQGVLGGGMF